MIKILLFVLVFNYTVSDTITNRTITPKHVKKRILISTLFSKKFFITEKTTDACRWLKGFKYQREQCQKRKGLAEVLNNARKYAIAECEDQFRYYRWNCSYTKDMFKKAYRETAFMQSLATAAIMFSTAKACTDGKLQNCHCAEETPSKRPDMKWGGCGDNTKKAAHITRRFMRVHHPSEKFRDVLNHSIEVGVKAVTENEKVHCYCPGGTTCAIKLCWKRIQPFVNIAQKLQYRYHSAIQVNSKNLLNKSSWRKQHADSLLYASNSTDFCGMTAGRRCINKDNCATLCCTRGYYEQKVVVPRRCHPKYHDCCYKVTYDICQNEEYIYYCK
ncbi:hypothetical protein AMK59_394 [Oryctes borbonicus]|uniref:Protein Wnt n=1 Tax=Oryctes borbonicus TaxID=1629725 RepID=A0A0T6BER4_9SCAR|nr:hypothetical protein AMK59_394 [Oryctes borbonicus]